MSLVNAAPALGRLVATVVAAAAAVALSALPDVIEEAERWVTHLGNVAAPLTGVVLADYVLVKRERIDVEALFDPVRPLPLRPRRQRRCAASPWRPAIVAYSVVPQEWVKVVWGLAASAVAYMALEPLQLALIARAGRAPATTEAA